MANELIIPEGFSHITLVWEGGGMPFAIAATFGVENGGGEVPQEVAWDIEDALTTGPGQAVGTTPNMTQLWSSDVVLSHIKVKNGPNATGPSVDYGLSLGGLGDADSESPQVAVLIKKVTGIGGPGSSGRMYFPPPGANDVSQNGIIGATELAEWNLRLAQFWTRLETLAHLPFVFHTQPDVGPALPPTAVLNFIAQSRVATQRRRNRR